MAQRAGNRGVLPGQRETRGAVVKGSRSPSGNGMARRALCGGSWEARSHVIRYISTNCGGALERRRVAAVAIRGIQRVIIIGVARRARGREVRPRQRKPRDAMVERCGVPASRGVAVGAIPHRERCAGSGMHRIVGSLPSGQMALRISAAIQGNL